MGSGQSSGCSGCLWPDTPSMTVSAGTHRGTVHHSFCQALAASSLIPNYGAQEGNRKCVFSVLVVLLARWTLPPSLPPPQRRLSSRGSSGLEPEPGAELAPVTQTCSPPTPAPAAAANRSQSLRAAKASTSATEPRPAARSSRSMPVKGGGRLASYPSRSDNVGVSDTPEPGVPLCDTP